MASTSSIADETDKSTASSSLLSRRERFDRYAESAHSNIVYDVALQRPRDYRARDGWLRMQDIDARISSSSSRMPQIRNSRASSLSSKKYKTLSEFRRQDTDRRARINQLYETLREQSSSSNTAESLIALDTATSKRQSPEDLRKAAVRRAYLQELYERINSDDDDRYGQSSSSGPSLDRLYRFVEQKEEALWDLFCAIDSNDDMLLSQDELLHSLHNADINISRDKLESMMQEMDKTGSGDVTFEEWRDFLLLLPRPCSMSNVYTYWQSFARPRLASSIATQDLDVVLAEMPQTTPLKDSSRSSIVPSSPSLKGKERAAPETAEMSCPSGISDPGVDTGTLVDSRKPEKGIFEGSGVYLLAGGIAGAVSRTATAPFDRLKVYLINAVDRSSVKLPSVSSTTHHPLQAARALASSGNQGMGAFVKAVNTLYQEAGLRAFFVGNGLNVIKIFPESAIKFWSYEYSKRWFARNVDDCAVADISGSLRFVAGGIGGVTSQLLIYPLETWKTRVMSSTSSAPGALKGNALYIETAKQMYLKGGVRAYFAGLVPAILGVFPYSAIDMSLFAAFKKTYSGWSGIEDPGPMASLSFGAISGGIGATSVYPLNLVRTRMQTQGSKAHPQRYTGWKDVVVTCYRNEGPRGFYKGLMPTLLKVSPSMGISWLVYESSTALFLPHPSHTKADTTEE